MNSLKPDKVVAFTIKGQSITREQYIKNNQEAVGSFNKGVYITQADILKKYSS